MENPKEEDFKNNKFRKKNLTNKKFKKKNLTNKKFRRKNLNLMEENPRKDDH
jgi:hypothetical protein